MRLFVTGGAGFIGSNFIRFVLTLSPTCEVVNFDKLTYAGNLENLADLKRNRRHTFVRGDICDSRVLSRAIQGSDVVVHFASESHVDRSIFDPELSVRTNVFGTQVLLESARKHRIPKFVHVSTDEVYGAVPGRKRADESWPLSPNSPYAASKASADMLVRAFVNTYKFPAVVARLSNCYGPFQFPEKFLPLVISSALEQKPIPVYGDGKQERDWLHVDDATRAVVAALTNGEAGEVYNFGGGKPRKNLDIVRLVLKILKRPANLIQHVEDRPGHDQRYALDSRKAQRELGWRARINFEHGLKQTIDWYAANRRWLNKVRSGEYKKFYATQYQHRAESLNKL